MWLNRTASGVVGLFLLVIFIASCGSSDVQKAKEFIAAGMYPQAMELLKKRVLEKPDDAEAHFNLGICLLNTGNLAGADERFASAVKLKSDYGFQIGGEFKKGADDALNQSDFNKAGQLYQRAVKYQPDLKEGIAAACYEKGLVFLNDGKTSQADALFAISRQHSNQYIEKISTATRDYAVKLIEEAKQKPVDQRRPLVNEASKFLSKSEIDGMFPPPEWKVVGEHKFVSVDGKKWMKTVNYPDDHKKGDLLIVEGNDFIADTYDGRLGPKNGVLEVDTSHIVPGWLLVKAPKNEKITVIVKRLQPNY